VSPHAGPRATPLLAPTPRGAGPAWKQARWTIDVGGRPASADELAALTRWTALKLETALERYPFEWAQDRAPRLEAVRALVAVLAGAAPWTQLHISMGGHEAEPRSFDHAAFDAAVAKVALQRFNANAPGPEILVRTGGPRDVQYPWSLRVTDLHLELHGPDTPAARKRMATLFTATRAAHDAAVWSTLGFGHAGRLSAALVKAWTMRSYQDHDRKLLAPPWRLHLGRLWTEVPRARATVETWAEKHGASLDRDGLLVAFDLPESPTDRSAVPAYRAAMTLQRAVAGIVNNAFHDAKERRAMGAPRKPS
jgi:hypothetical protein